MAMMFLDSYLVGFFLALVCGVVSPLVVIKRLSGLTGSVSHTSFAGIGAAVLWGFNPLWGAMLSGVMAALLIDTIQQKTRDHQDTLLALVWVVGMAVGLLLLHFRQGYTADLFGYLFGNILLVSQQDTWVMMGWAFFVVGLCLTFFQLIQLGCVDEEYALIRQVPVRWVNRVMLSVLAVTTVLASKGVGILLVMALLSIPGAIAGLLCRTLASMMLVSVGVALGCVLGGLWLTTWFNVPSGPTMILSLAGLYGMGYVAKRITR